MKSSCKLYLVCVYPAIVVVIHRVFCKTSVRVYPEVLLGSVTTLCPWSVCSSYIIDPSWADRRDSSFASTFPCGSIAVSSCKCAVDVIFVDRSVSRSFGKLNYTWCCEFDGVVCVAEECFLSAVHELWVKQL